MRSRPAFNEINYQSDTKQRSLMSRQVFSFNELMIYSYLCFGISAIKKCFLDGCQISNDDIIKRISTKLRIQTRYEEEGRLYQCQYYSIPLTTVQIFSVLRQAEQLIDRNLFSSWKLLWIWDYDKNCQVCNVSVHFR